MGKEVGKRFKREGGREWSRTVVSDSLWPHGLQPTRLLCPWDFPGKSTGVGCHIQYSWAFLLAQMVKNLPAMQQTRVRSLGREDPLEKDMAPHSSTLAWRIPWIEEPGRLQSMGSRRVRHDWATSLSRTVSEEFWTGTLIWPPKDSFSSCWETFW